MAQSKTRARSRRLALLRRIGPDGLGVNCEGGVAHDDPDLQRLVADGMVRIVRARKDSAFGPHIRRTKAVLA